MYDLVKVSERGYYIQSPTNIGAVVTGEDQVCLIDSGNDKDAGKKVKRILDGNGWKLQAVYNTHAHADHTGGNQYLQKQTGCRVYARGVEHAFAAHPILEPSFLYGANPPGELRHKFLLAQDCDAMPLTVDCLPEGMRIIPLPGHSWDMAGFLTADGVAYLGDCLSSRETLEKYQISFLVDVQAYLETLEAIQRIEARLFVPSHAQPAEDIVPLAQANIRKVYDVADAILRICQNPTTFEGIMKRLFDEFHLTMTFEQHALVGSTVRSYLTWLKEQGRLRAFFEENTLLWTAEGE